MNTRKKEIKLKTKLEDIIILSNSLIQLANEINQLYNEIKLDMQEEK